MAKRARGRDDVLAVGEEMDVDYEVVQERGRVGEGTEVMSTTTKGASTWEKILLPRIPVRVLLIEGDDSTRTVIAALLRKCSYRVTVISDGMSAWELLKKPSNFDLVLSEVDLPLISGFILLSMMMENEGCKNIPIIMMSSNDSMSTIFKCMLKGAADVLVKPIRKNELMNLWQHVWRRQLSAGGLGKNIPGCAFGVESVEGKSFVHNAGWKSKDKECSEQRSDVQSSCTRSEMEAESKQTVNILHCKLPADGDVTMVQKQDEANNPDNPNTEDNVLINTICSDEDFSDDKDEQRSNTRKETDNVDLISPTMNGSNNLSTNAPHLNLSLRRFESPNAEACTNEGGALNHSTSSAFCQYNSALGTVGRASKPTCDTAPNPDVYLDGCIEFDSSIHTDQGKAIRCTPMRILPYPITLGSSTPDNWESTQMLSAFCPFSVHQLWNQGTTTRQETTTANVNSLHLNADYAAKAMESGNSNPPCDDAVPSSNNVCLVASTGSRGNMSEDNCSNSVLQNSTADPLKNLSQRELALHKFRLKRKERCFEKKVRYHSRKLLAEQRPRIKGQFVRQEQRLVQNNDDG